MPLSARRVGGSNIVYYTGNRLRIIDAVGPDVVKLFEDFTGIVATSDALVGWTTTLVEAGAGESTVTIPDAAAGTLLLTADANDNDGVNLQMIGETFGLSSSQLLTYFGARFKASEATQSDWLLGLCITDTDLLGGMTDGVYFEKVDGGTGISFTTEKDSTETQSDSLGTFAADTWTTVEFCFANGAVYAFLNGTLVATHTDNIPDDELLTPSIQFLNGAAGAGKTMTVDWIRAIQIGR